MAEDRKLDEIVADARLKKLFRQHGDAAALYIEAAGKCLEGEQADQRKALLRQAAACTYLNTKVEKEERMSTALGLLSAHAEQVSALLELAMGLKAELAFGQARLVLAQARANLKAHWNAIPGLADTEARDRLEVKARQQHGLTTYKDVDLPPGDRFDEALKILDGSDELAVQGVIDLKTTNDSETLGIAGAVHKAKWKYDAQRAHLEQSLKYYERGYRQGIDKDDGYTGINAAYVLDLLASLEADELGADEPAVAQRREQASKIREEILAKLSGGDKDLSKAPWWYIATLAEAEFGLRQFDQAAKRLKDARERNAVQIAVEDWEVESTARQLASLTQLLARDEPSHDAARAAFSLAFALSFDAASTFLTGKFGLALSGGGFRASLFHIGVLARLAELDVLRHVEVLSCVSGGSIIGAYYYLELQKLFIKKKLEDITREDYVAMIHVIATEFLEGVQSNVRMRMVGSFLSNLGMIRTKLSRTERIATLLEEKIYSRINDQERLDHTEVKESRKIKDLRITPLDWEANARGPFQPKYHNWQLKAKVPILILNATALNTGHNWQFTAMFMGESPLAIDAEIDGNYRLRRLYYDDAPTEELKQFSLARAVAASASVPVLFEPISVPGLYPGKTVRLADGGVHDNQGIVGLLEQDCTILIVSDASGHVGVVDDPVPSQLKVAVRSNDLLMARVRGAQYRDLKARLRSRVVRGLMFLHLGKDLEVDPIDWKGCKDRSTVPVRPILTSYGIRKDVQEKLAAIRTDLDAFGDAEAFALMTSGYHMTDHMFPECIGKLLTTNRQRKEDWNFLEIEKLIVDPGTDADRDREHLLWILDVGRHQFFKFYYAYPLLMRVTSITGQALLFAGLIALLYVWLTMPSYHVLTAGQVAVGLIPIFLSLLGLGRFVSWLFPSQAINKMAGNVGIAVAGCVVATVQLTVFDRWYLSRSRYYRKSIQRPAASVNSRHPK